jgi:nitrous oxidase accessory protein
MRPRLPEGLTFRRHPFAALIVTLGGLALAVPGRGTSTDAIRREALPAAVPLPHGVASDASGAFVTSTAGAASGVASSPAQAEATDQSPAVAGAGVPGTEWVVEPGTDLSTITRALELARSGDRIVVKSGVYREPTLTVEKPVELVGQGRPILDGEGERQLMTIVADDVSVSGFVFKDVGVSFVEDRAAIRVEDSLGCRIADNRFEDAFFGIYLANSGSCDILNNELTAQATRESQSANGIHLWYSRNVTIRGNRIEGHRDGIYFEFVEDSRIEGNESRGNLRYGLHFMFSDRCAYSNNVFAENGAGVAVMYTEDVTMRNNVFDHNWGNASFGILMKDIRDSELSGNLFHRNSIGILAEGSNRLQVLDNDFVQNGWAVKIMANSLDNVFTRNNFVGNSFDVTTNSRRSYSTFEGNYWDDYRGYDLDRDGVGDVPFRPVRLFSLIVEQNEPSLVLLRSFLVALLDAAERVVPALTPETLVDERPSMQRIQ